MVHQPYTTASTPHNTHPPRCPSLATLPLPPPSPSPQNSVCSLRSRVSHGLSPSQASSVPFVFLVVGTSSSRKLTSEQGEHPPASGTHKRQALRGHDSAGGPRERSHSRETRAETLGAECPDVRVCRRVQRSTRVSVTARGRTYRQAKRPAWPPETQEEECDKVKWEEWPIIKTF